MRDDFEVEEGQEVVRRTIVGGRPRARAKRRIRVPIGLEKLLCRAAGDPAFRVALFRDRQAALDDAGYELLPSEQAVLASVPDAVLAAMIGRIDVRRHSARTFMKGVFAAAFASAAATATLGCDIEAKSAGISPDAVQYDAADTFEMQAGVDIQPPGELDVEEIYPDLGIDPDEGPPSDEVVIPEVYPDAGVAPDVPDEDPDVIYSELPMPAGILPDGEDL